MAANLTQIRVICEDPQPLRRADQLWNFLSIKEASCTDFFLSKFNTPQNPKKMIIFKFMTQAIRDKALSIPTLENKLTEFNLTLHNSANQGTDHRTIFINQLPTSIFYFFAPSRHQKFINPPSRHYARSIQNIKLTRHPP